MRCARAVLISFGIPTWEVSLRLILAFLAPSSCGMLPDVPSGLLQTEVALLISAPRAEAQAHDGRPRSPLEQQDGEDDAKAEAQGGFYQEVGEAAVPLREGLSALALHCCSRSFFKTPAVLDLATSKPSRCDGCLFVPSRSKVPH